MTVGLLRGQISTLPFPTTFPKMNWLTILCPVGHFQKLNDWETKNHPTPRKTFPKIKWSIIKITMWNDQGVTALGRVWSYTFSPTGHNGLRGCIGQGLILHFLTHRTQWLTRLHWAGFDLTLSHPQDTMAYEAALGRVWSYTFSPTGHNGLRGCIGQGLILHFLTHRTQWLTRLHWAGFDFTLSHPQYTRIYQAAFVIYRFLKKSTSFSISTLWISWKSTGSPDLLIKKLACPPRNSLVGTGGPAVKSIPDWGWRRSLRH